MYAMILLHKAGKDITAENITKVLFAGEIEVDKHEVEKLEIVAQNLDIDAIINNALIVPVQVAIPIVEPEVEEIEEKEDEEEFNPFAKLFG